MMMQEMMEGMRKKREDASSFDGHVCDTASDSCE